MTCKYITSLGGDLKLSVADSFLTRAAGLLFSPSPESGQGLLITHCASVHMFFMRYAIDVVFIDAAGRILKLCPALKPWSMAACRQARHVIELRDGDIQKFGLQQGQVIALEWN